MAKTYLYRIIFLTSFWVFAAAFIVSYEGAVLGFKSPIEGVYYNYGQTLITVVLVAFFAGGGIAVFEVLFFSGLVRKKSLGTILAIKTTFYLSNMFVFISLATIIIISSELNKPVFHTRVLETYLEYISSKKFLLTMLYWGLANLFALFVLQVSEKFGQGVLFNFLLGKYHKPKQETRIFMFLDLKSSTTHAERLGHIKYSQLIQDCFFDLTDIVITNQAQIYQYVGDEVVLTWEYDKGIKNNNCFKMFFEYDNLLNVKRQYYQEKYQLVPQFKAGLNSGDVTVAEVGELKKELAYHGDVLNTAARIQAKCNEFNKNMLISEYLKDKMDKKSVYKFEYLDSIILRGRKEKVGIYSVEL